MIINGNDSLDLTGLNKRDLRDIEKNLAKERENFESMGWDERTVDCMTNAVYHALVICKKKIKRSTRQRNTEKTQIRRNNLKGVYL